jgi:uncharacterized protein (DUF433 family)
MQEQNLQERITLDPKVMVGKPVIRGTRLTVEYILRLLADGVTMDEILEECDGLTVDDIRACMLFASNALADMSFMPLTQEKRSPTNCLHWCSNSRN